jgi:hypothetical protein
MATIRFKQTDKRVGLAVALGFLAVAFAGLFVIFGVGGVADFVNAFPSVKLMGILAALVFLLPPILMVRRLYRTTEVDFGGDAIAIKTAGRPETVHIRYAEIQTADLHKSTPGALSLFSRDGRLLHRFAPYNDSTSLDALVAGLIRTGQFRIEDRPVKVFGGAMSGRLFTRKV